MRGHFSRCLGETGSTEAAVRELEKLLADELRLLGLDHPVTLSTRHNLALYLGEAGRLDDASRQMEVLLADRIRVLGPDHRATLNTRHNLAATLDELGRIEEAVGRFEELLADELRVLRPRRSGHARDASQPRFDPGEGRATERGPSPNGGAAGRSNAGSRTSPSGHARDAPQPCLGAGKVGRLEEATRLLEELLADQHALLGPDHPNTLGTRLLRASLQGDAGQAEAAVAQLEEVLVDTERVLGPDHPDTLSTRGSLAAARPMTGGRTSASARFEACSPTWCGCSARTIQHAHDPGATRCIAGQGGAGGRGFRQLEALMADRLRVLGPDHPSTLATRGDLAYLLGKAGKVAEAVGQSEKLLADELRLLGPDHPGALTTRHNHAGLLADAGRTEEAARLSVELLVDRTRVLGRDPLTLSRRTAISSTTSGWRGGSTKRLASSTSCRPTSGARSASITPTRSRLGRI